MLLTLYSRASWVRGLGGGWGGVWSRVDLCCTICSRLIHTPSRDSLSGYPLTYLNDLSRAHVPGGCLPGCGCCGCRVCIEAGRAGPRTHRWQAPACREASGRPSGAPVCPSSSRLPHPCGVVRGWLSSQRGVVGFAWGSVHLCHHPGSDGLAETSLAVCVCVRGSVVVLATT